MHLPSDLTRNDVCRFTFVKQLFHQTSVCSCSSQIAFDVTRHENRERCLVRNSRMRKNTTPSSTVQQCPRGVAPSTKRLRLRPPNASARSPKTKHVLFQVTTEYPAAHDCPLAVDSEEDPLTSKASLSKDAAWGTLQAVNPPGVSLQTPLP